MFRRLFKRTPRAIAIPDMLWPKVAKSLPWFARLSEHEQQHLRLLVSQFLKQKTITPAFGMTFTDDMRISIAAQACLPILKLDLSYYSGWQEVIVYPGEFIVPRSEMDDDGVVHEYFDTIAGEAWDGGPVILSWNNSDLSLFNPSFNIVIHEFAHKIDLRNGAADGMPPLSPRWHRRINYAYWQRIMRNNFEDFSTRVQLIERSLPAHIDPTSEQAAPYYADLPLDAYAAESISEFFAICSEAFFITPTQLHHGYPHVYDLLAQFYRQDPLMRLITPTP